MTKEEEELSSFTPKSPISKPYIPDELNDPTVYPEILAAFEDAQAKYIAKLCKPLYPSPSILLKSATSISKKKSLQPPNCACLVSLAYHSLHAVGQLSSLLNIGAWTRPRACFIMSTFITSVNLQKRRCFVPLNLSSGSDLLSVRMYTSCLVACCLIFAQGIKALTACCGVCSCRGGATDTLLWFVD
jgi:hypothetical protein